MKSLWTTQLGLASLLLLGACTDGRPLAELELNEGEIQTGVKIDSVSEFQYSDSAGAKDTNAMQMVIKGGALYMTGKPFGFARLNLTQDYRNPDPTFWASQTGLLLPPGDPGAFSQQGKWIVSNYASGALAIFGATAFMSGTVGSSVVSMAETHKPRETRRYPSLDPNSDVVPSDEAFVYQAMAVHPTKQILYGFRKQDFVYTIDLSGGQMKIVAKDGYGAPGESVCCAMGAATFGNHVYVAFRDKIVAWEISADGRLQNPKVSTMLNPVNVVATARYLYIQHEPTLTPGPASSKGAAIYVFDANFKSVGRFQAGSPKRFAVAEDDSHFYSNIDGKRIEIYSLSWTN